MVGTPFVAALALCRPGQTEAPACTVEEALAPPEAPPRVVPSPPAIPCVDDLAERRRPATVSRGLPIELDRGPTLDASWTSFVTASVRAVVGDSSTLTTGATRLAGQTLVVATTRDGLGRSVSAFTINTPDMDAGQVAHRVCGHRLTAAYAVSPGVVEVQFDDGWAVWATATGIVTPET